MTADSPTSSSGTPTKGLARNTAVMAVGTLLSRITGFGRTVVLVAALGASDRLPDVYNLANNAPNVVYELILGGILTGTLVPVFVHRFTRSDGGSDEAGWEAVSAILSVTAVALVALVGVVVVGAPWIIDLYTLRGGQAGDSQARSVATFLLRLFAPQVAFYGFISIATAVLQAKRRFAIPMFAPILNNVVVICVLLAFPSVAKDTTLAAVRNDTFALVFLGLGTTAGVAAMGLCLLPALRNTAKGHLRWNWNPTHEAIRTVVKLSGWTVGFVIANQIALMVTLVLAYATKGDSTIFLQAYTFFILPHGIFTVSVISALQPELAERWARADIDGFRDRAQRALRIIAAVIIPAAIGYVLLARPIVDLIPHHGAFDASDARRLAGAVAWMAVGLPGFSAFIFVTRTFQSMPDARTVFYLYVFQNAFNVITAFPLHAAMGVNGLALSQSISYTAAAIAGYFVLSRRTQGFHGASLAPSLGRILAASVAMGVTVTAVTYVTPGTSVLDAIAGILSGAVVYLAASRLFGAREIDLFLRSRGR